MPLTLEDQSEDFIPDRRHVTIFDEQVSADGTVQLAAVVDYGDALDIETALQDTAAQLKLAGSADTLDGRRAAALGEIARNQLALTYPTDDDGEGEDGVGLVEERAQRASRNRRPVTLYVHLSEDALATTAGQVGRCENARTPITAETIRSWCGNPSVTLTVKPVIDLADHVRVDAYEVPDRLKERIALRDLACVFPWCTRPARTACDHDHAIPHDHGGSTCYVQHRRPVSTPPPAQDPHPLALQDPRTRRLPVDLPPRLRVPPRPHRHHRRHPRRADPDPRLPRHRPAPTRHRSSHPAPHPATTPPWRGHRHARGVRGVAEFRAIDLTDDRASAAASAERNPLPCVVVRPGGFRPELPTEDRLCAVAARRASRSPDRGMAHAPTSGASLPTADHGAHGTIRVPAITEAPLSRRTQATERRRS